MFVFPLFLDMVMYANEIETKEKQKLPEIKKLAATCTILNIQILLSLFDC